MPLKNHVNTGPEKLSMQEMAKSVALILGKMWKPQGHSGERKIESKTREWEHQAEGQGESWVAQLGSSNTDKHDHPGIDKLISDGGI